MERDPPQITISGSTETPPLNGSHQVHCKPRAGRVACSSLQPGCSPPSSPSAMTTPSLIDQPQSLWSLSPYISAGLRPWNTRLLLSISGGLWSSGRLSDSPGWSVLFLRKEVPVTYQLGSGGLGVGPGAPRGFRERDKRRVEGWSFPQRPSLGSWCICPRVPKTLLQAPRALSGGRVGRDRCGRTV